MERTDSIWDVIKKNPLEVVLCVVLVAIVVVTFSQVLFRYVFRTSLDWSEELARFLFLWLAALSSAYAFKTKSHFALRFVVNRFGTGLRTVANDLVAARDEGVDQVRLGLGVTNPCGADNGADRPRKSSKS